MAIELILVIGSALILLSVGIAKISDTLGVPALVLFLAIGMLAGSEGPGGIYFDSAPLAQSIGIVCLVIILFTGGLDTRWSDVKPVFGPAAWLATLGVLLTTLAVGVFTHVVTGLPLLSGLLLGAVISSTDAAAVFSVLGSKHVHLRGSLKPLLELESGSNDPMAVFLTVSLIQLIQTPTTSTLSLVLLFLVQMGLGALAGLGSGRLMTVVLNHAKLPYEGMYPVFVLAHAALTFGVTTAIGGSGFLAVYVAGMTCGSQGFIHQRSLMRFFDGLAWLSQIGMFLTLGLLVFPSRIVPTIGIGVLVSAFLMLVARPLGVGASLIFSSYRFREKLFVSWVGLRGAVPIVLATYVLIGNIPDAQFIFNLVFFIVLTSALLQGWSIPVIARLLRLDAPAQQRRPSPLELLPQEGMNADLIDCVVPAQSWVIDRPLVELQLPADALVVLVGRQDQYFVPSGSTTLEAGDTILALVSKESIGAFRATLSRTGEQ